MSLSVVFKKIKNSLGAILKTLLARKTKQVDHSSNDGANSVVEDSYFANKPVHLLESLANPLLASWKKLGN